MGDAVMEAAAELGYRANVDLNGENPIGYTIAQANNRNGARLSSNKAFITPILDRPNLFVSMNSHVSGNKVPALKGKESKHHISFITCVRSSQSIKYKFYYGKF
jgi:choline dehydrogenase-like flavoprotein